MMLLCKYLYEKCDLNLLQNLKGNTDHILFIYFIIR